MPIVVFNMSSDYCRFFFFISQSSLCLGCASRGGAIHSLREWLLASFQNRSRGTCQWDAVASGFAVAYKKRTDIAPKMYITYHVLSSLVCAAYRQLPTTYHILAPGDRAPEVPLSCNCV